jgi:hypothetical protein
VVDFSWFAGLDELLVEHVFPSFVAHDVRDLGDRPDRDDVAAVRELLSRNATGFVGVGTPKDRCNQQEK